MAEALQLLQRALRSQPQGNAPRPAASTPPQSRPTTPRLNPPPRGAWQNQQQRNAQGFRGGTANQSGSTRGGSFRHGLGMMELTGHKHHRILSEINNSLSRVQSPRH